MFRTLTLVVIMLTLILSFGTSQASQNDSGWYEEFAGMIKAERAKLKDVPFILDAKISNKSADKSFTVTPGGHNEILLDVTPNKKSFIHLTNRNPNI
jgi:hypothetical protein